MLIQRIGVILAVAGAAQAFGQATLTEIPVPAGNFQQTNAYAVSGDGLVVVGNCGSGVDTLAPTNPVPILWTQQGGVELLSGVPAAAHGSAYGVSGDGSVVCGGLGVNNSFRWTRGTGAVGIPTIQGATQSLALSVSRDGLALAGYTLNSPTYPYLWTASGSTQQLGSGAGTARATNLNGSVVVGSIPSFAVRWVGNVMQAFRVDGAGYAVTPDGMTVVGHITPAGGVSRATRWVFDSLDGTSNTEMDLGVVPGPTPEVRKSVAQAVSDDGRVIAGFSTRYASGVPVSSLPRSAFVWKAELGMVDLNVYLPTLGVDLTGWDLRIANGISADGTVIVGQGTHNGAPRGFVVRLGRACSTADFDNDGDTATDADIEAFFACLAGNCCATCYAGGPDFDADGDPGTDADIESFFRVIAGGHC